MLIYKGFNCTNLTKKEKKEIEKRRRKTKILRLVFILCLVFGIGYFNPQIIVNLKQGIENKSSIYGVHKAKVIGVKKEEYTYLGNTYDKKQGLQNIDVEITAGKFKGRQINVQNNYNNNNPYSYLIKKGDKVFLSIDQEGNLIKKAYIYDFDRSMYILILSLAIFFAMLLFGGKSGVKTFLAIMLVLPIILKILPYYIFKGYNHGIVIFISSFFIICILSLIPNGINVESISSIIGALVGTLIGGILVYIFQYLCKITGISSNEFNLIVYKGKEINLIGILYAGIIIGALGAITNISLNVTKAMQEAEIETLNIKFSELLKIGFKEGKNSIGKISSTLIMAYIGATLQTVIIFMVSSNMCFLQIINGETMVLEILRVISGIIGFICAIPITTFIYAFITKQILAKQK